MPMIMSAANPRPSSAAVNKRGSSAPSSARTRRQPPPVPPSNSVSMNKPTTTSLATSRSNNLAQKSVAHNATTVRKTSTQEHPTSTKSSSTGKSTSTAAKNVSKPSNSAAGRNSPKLTTATATARTSSPSVSGRRTPLAQRNGPAVPPPARPPPRTASSQPKITATTTTTTTNSNSSRTTSSSPLSVVSKWATETKPSTVSKQSVGTTGSRLSVKSLATSLANGNGADSKKTGTSLQSKPNEEDSMYEPVVYRGLSESNPKPKTSMAGSVPCSKKSETSSHVKRNPSAPPTRPTAPPSNPKKTQANPTSALSTSESRPHTTAHSASSLAGGTAFASGRSSASSQDSSRPQRKLPSVPSTSSASSKAIYQVPAPLKPPRGAAAAAGRTKDTNPIYGYRALKQRIAGGKSRNSGKDPSSRPGSGISGKVKNLMNEIIQTEMQYVADLEHVCKHYIPAMDFVSELPRALVGKKNVIFGNIPALLKFNQSEILPGLQHCEQSPLQMGSVFLENKDNLMLYVTYMKINHRQEVDEIMGEEFFKVVQEGVGDRLSLSSYLLKPMQRITKYRLFVEQMLSLGQKSDPEETLGEQNCTEKEKCLFQLQEALKEVDYVLRRGNDVLALASLKDYKGNIAEEGKLLRVGILAVVDALTVRHRRKIFLFENSIILAKIRKTGKSGPTGSDTYQFMNYYRTNELGMRQNIKGHPSWLELTKGKEAVQLEASNEAEKNEWVQCITELLIRQQVMLREKALQIHGATPSFYDIQLTPENDLEKTDGGRPKSTMLKVVSEPLLLRSSIGAATAAAVRDNGYASERPPSSPAPVHHSILSGEVKPKETLKNSLSREEVSLVKMLALHSYTIPSFSAITVKLRQVEVCRQGITLDAFCKESVSLSSISLTLPKRISVHESCIVPESEFSKAIPRASDLRILKGRGVYIIWEWS